MFRIMPFILVSIVCAQTYNWPISSFTSEHSITATYGELRSDLAEDRDHVHNGVDMFKSGSTPVYPVLTGDVIASYNDNGITKVVVGADDFSIQSYVEMENIQVATDDSVTAGVTILGYINTTSASTHLHFLEGDIDGAASYNPLYHLTPYSDTQNPVIEDVFITEDIDNWSTSFGDLATIYPATNYDVVVKLRDVTNAAAYCGIEKIEITIIDKLTSAEMTTASDIQFFYRNSAADWDVKMIYGPGSVNKSGDRNFYYVATNGLAANSYFNPWTWFEGEYDIVVDVYDYGDADGSPSATGSKTIKLLGSPGN